MYSTSIGYWGVGRVLYLFPYIHSTIETYICINTRKIDNIKIYGIEISYHDIIWTNVIHQRKYILKKYIPALYIPNTTNIMAFDYM